MEENVAWQALKRHHRQIDTMSLRDLFLQDPLRFERFSLSFGELLLDFSKNRVTTETLKRLMDLACASGIAPSRAALFSGESVNWTEGRPVLHTALRNRGQTAVFVEGRDVMPLIRAEWEKMRLFSERFRAQSVLGQTGKPLRVLVNIGIGGSHLGPEMIVQALLPYGEGGPEVRFIANLDGSDFCAGVKDLDPEETLFVVSSKTFTTRETLLNAHSARQWLRESGVPESDLGRHFVAITAVPELALQFGVDAEQIFSLWSWVGGRYSWCSAIGLCIAARFGFDVFMQLLDGAHAMDRHFFEAPLAQNMPVLMAMLGIWNIHFLGAETHAIIPYDHLLRRFPAFLQQCDMESNGKRVNKNGQVFSYSTGPILWGEPGSNCQHSFFQLLHQGTHLVPIDFIASSNSQNPMGAHHTELIANCFAQSEALMWGNTPQEVYADLQASGLSEEAINQLLPHRVFPGNQPSNTLLLRRLTPFNLGMLIALYEMKIYVQGIVWGINSFDQWGVELGKTLAEQIRQEAQGLLVGDAMDLSRYTVSTQGLLHRFVKDQEGIVPESERNETKVFCSGRRPHHPHPSFLVHNANLPLKE